MLVLRLVIQDANLRTDHSGCCPEIGKQAMDSVLLRCMPDVAVEGSRIYASYFCVA